MYDLWDYIDIRGENVILAWVSDERLSKRDRAALNQKIRRLSQMDYALAIATKLLAGPIYEHIYKLVIHGDVMLRPLLCRGPINNLSEYTFLLGAIEKGWKLPDGAMEKAAKNREIILGDNKRRVPHVFIP